MKKTIIGLLATVAVLGGLSSVADAKVKVRIYLGEPYYDYQMGPDYQYYNGRGWYRPMHRNQISCNQAQRLVRQSGFRHVMTRECDGRTYTFFAQRHGHRVLVYVNSRTGAIWRG